MTELLERAITRLKTLAASEQDAIASMILEELEEDRRWDEALSRSPDTLAQLAAIAMAEYHAGKTQELEPETLSGKRARYASIFCRQIVTGQNRIKPVPLNT
jgi:hypothetical protein